MKEPCILLMLLAIIAVQHGVGATTYVCVGVHYTSFNTLCTYKYDNISYAFESHHKTSDTTFVIQPGNYTLLPVNIAFDSINNTNIMGNVSKGNNVIVNCQPHTGLYFYNSRNININDVSFISCGATYGNNGNSTLFHSLNNAMCFVQCSNVSIKGVTVANSTGTAVYMQATLGSNVIKDCTFKYNIPSHDSQGSSIVITFPECPHSVAKCENNQYSQDQLSYSKYTIYNCTFMNNQANDSQVNISRADDLDDGRGGGIYIYIGWKAQNNTISVDMCSFEHNTALYGGGAYIGIAQYSKYNTITFTNSSFVNNEAVQGGGGVRIQFQFIIYNIYKSVAAHNNQVNFFCCRFTENSASLGGGLSLYTTNEKMINKFSFYDCTWSANTAKTGSAVDMTAWLSFDGSPPQPYFSNCTFHNNIPQMLLPLSGVSESSSVGTMYLDSVSVMLDNVNFTNNQGTAIYAINNHLLFLKGSHTTFDKNSGTNGGGIALIGNAAIAVETNVTIKFTNNTASVHGGAIYAFASSQHDDIFSINCFIHSHEPKETPNIGWQALLYFRNNTANGRNESIFATTLRYCTWKYQEEDTSFIFCSESHFDFGPNVNCEEEVRSLPKQIKTSSLLSVVLGKSTLMQLNVTDDYNKSVDSYVLIATSTSEIEVDKDYQYISDQRVKLKLKNHPSLTNETESIILRSLFPRVLELNVSVKPLPCPPGYWIDENSGECQCSEYSFGGSVIRCQSNFIAMIRKGFWIGYYNNVSVVGRCRFCAANLNQKHGGFIELPDSYDRVNDVLCGGKKEGVLCTSCSNNGSFALNVVSYECIECSSKEFKYTWIYVILTQFLPVLVLLLVIICANIPLASGYLNGAIFFSQVITTSLDISGDGEIPLENITESADVYIEVFEVIYGIWNLDFIEPVKYCLAPNLTINSIFAWEYVIALLPFIIVAILCIIHLCNEGRCAGRMERCKTMTVRNIQHICCNINVEFNTTQVLTNAISSCILLGYTRCALNTCYILNWTHLYNSSNHIVATVPYFDGSTKFGHGHHILYMSIAFVVAILLVAFPFILLCARHKSYLETNNVYVKFFNAILTSFQSDFKGSLTQEEERQLPNIQGLPPKYCCRPYLCFSDLRWVAGLYFILRLAMALAFVFSNTFITQVLVQQILATVMIIVFAILQPYKEERHNKIDCCIFLLIIVINSITLYQYSLTVAMEKLSTTAFVIQYILVYVPMFLIAFFIINRVKLWCQARCQQCIQAGGEHQPLTNVEQEIN